MIPATGPEMNLRGRSGDPRARVSCRALRLPSGAVGGTKEPGCKPAGTASGGGRRGVPKEKFPMPPRLILPALALGLLLAATATAQHHPQQPIDTKGYDSGPGGGDPQPPLNCA